MAKKTIKRDSLQLFAEKRDFSNKKRPKRDPKSGLGLIRDPGLLKETQLVAVSVAARLNLLTLGRSCACRSRRESLRLMTR